MWWSDPAQPAPHQRRRRRRLSAGLVCAALLPGCGFALRQPPPLQFQRIALVGFEARSPLADELRRTLAGVVQVVADPAQAQVVLRATAEQRQTSVAGSTAAAQVRELQLRLRVTVQADTPAGRMLMAPVALVLERDLSFNEQAALAKAQEEESLFREMQSDVVAQLLRRLAAIRL